MSFRDQFFPLGDHFYTMPNYMAKWTGEFRVPEAGEWYLSGAVVHAYKAQRRLGNPFHIARICKVKKVTTIIEVTEQA